MLLDVQRKDLPDDVETIDFDRVLLIGDADGETKVGQPVLEGAKVTAKVVGDIWHEVLSIESGAYIEGQLKRAKKGAEEREIVPLLKLKVAPVADQPATNV